MKPRKIRIIGGTHKRRFIEFADVNGLRPTPDRLRETIFNWLMPYLHGATVLDMCAGSGVLGFECVSRGASHATLIEPNKKQFSYLKKTATLLQATNNTLLINAKAENALAQLTNKPFDVIFIDPPYSLNLWSSLISSVFEHNLVHAESLLYIEADKPHTDIGIDSFLTQTLTPLKDKKTGQIFSCLYQVH